MKSKPSSNEIPAINNHSLSPRDTPTHNRKKKPRAVSSGDTAPSLTSDSIEKHVVRQSIEAAQTAQTEAVETLLQNPATADIPALAHSLRTIIEGASPDDAAILRQALLADGSYQPTTPDPDTELSDDWREGGYPYKNLLSRKCYEQNKYHLQVELLKLQAWVKTTKQKVIILFEGRDAAGKGGTIKRFMEHLPTAGEIVMFDRSWYNRAGVERVMGFCTDEEYSEFMRQAPEFERNLVRSGIHLVKFWFSVSRAEQRRRFEERKAHPLKQWKLSPVDLASLDKWDVYTKAKESMFFYTDTADSPWTVIKSDCKKRARLNAMRYVLHRLPYTNKDAGAIGAIDPLLVGRAHIVYEVGEHPGNVPGV